MPGTKWLTFDCYGTLADWNACMSGALEPIAGEYTAPLLSAYHRTGPILEALPEWRPYREVLTEGLRLAARRISFKLLDEQEDGPWLNILRSFNGTRSLDDLVTSAGTSMEAVLPLVRESLEAGLLVTHEGMHAGGRA